MSQLRKGGKSGRMYVGGYVVWEWVDIHRELYLRTMFQWLEA